MWRRRQQTIFIVLVTAITWLSLPWAMFTDTTSRVSVGPSEIIDI